MVLRWPPVGARGTRYAALAAVLTLALGTAVSYAHPLGHTTEDHQIVQGPEKKPGFFELVEGPGSPRVARPLPHASMLDGRESRRASLSYFAQLTDFQLADEESPARVEFADPGAASAWRPQEAFHPWVVDWSFRQLNEFTGASPHTQAGGARAAMDFGLLTGDQSDNQQYNETVWVRQLVEGGQELDPNSGIDDFSGCPLPDEKLQTPDDAYAGVQDYDDYEPDNGAYYDPDQPSGTFENWPQYTALMSRAQQPFTPVGLRRGGDAVPTYVANGNHDGLVQGNEDAIQAYEQVALGCRKLFFGNGSPSSGGDPSPGDLLLGGVSAPVPPDPDRHFVDRVEMKQIYRSGSQADDHGLSFIDPAENSGSGFTATYYAWDPKPGLRFISVDTVSDGGTVEDSSQGNIDDPQWKWLEQELAAARAAGKLIVLFGHHPIRSLTSRTPDEAASPCSGNYSSEDEASYSGAAKDSHGHDVNPGCDLDPRSSQPVHNGSQLANLLSSNPHVVAYVAGHTHENEILACGSSSGCPAGGNWWEINTSATADWPQQHRLVELMDNRDGTLSIFGTALDHGSRYETPAEGDASGFEDETLASLGRSFSYNDPQSDHTAAGGPEDRNVELLVDDPRTPVITGTRGSDVIQGTPGRDVIICGPGNDVVHAGAGDDIIRCGPGNDTVFAEDGNDRASGDEDNDRLLGGRGLDRLYGRSGRDRMYGESGSDRIYGGSGGDGFSGGSGNDRMGGSSGRDRMNGGSGRDRIAGQSGRDRLAGGSGGDRLFGGSSGDRLAGQSGNDRLAGGRGNDLLIGGPGRDRLFGGPGRDRRRR
jgi:hypothetical protein